MNSLGALLICGISTYIHFITYVYGLYFTKAGDTGEMTRPASAYLTRMNIWHQFPEIMQNKQTKTKQVWCMHTYLSLLARSTRWSSGFAGSPASTSSRQWETKQGWKHLRNESQGCLLSLMCVSTCTYASICPCARERAHACVYTWSGESMSNE